MFNVLLYEKIWEIVFFIDDYNKAVKKFIFNIL